MIRMFIKTLFFLLLPVGLFAGTTGKIVGTLADQKTGEKLPGVNIIIDETRMGAVTDLDGYYMINNIPPGTYTLTYKLIGYQARSVADVKVSIDLTTTINQKMNAMVIETGEQMTVVADRPIVTRDQTSALSSISSDKIQAMPVQEVSDVLELQAGLVRDAMGGLHVRGGRSGEVAYWVDGIAATDNYSGNIGVQVENSSVQELQVISGTFNAEYGQAMSAVVNIVTKEGGAKFNGEFSAFVGDYVSMDDQNYWVMEPTSQDLRAIREPQAGAYQKTNPLRKFNPTYNVQGSLSGPLFKDRLTFFTNVRYFQNEGYLYGKRWFTPQGLKGDGKLVSLNPYEKISGQAKLAYRLTPNMKLTYSLIGNTNNFKWYDRYYKYNPDATLQRFEDGLNNTLALTHTMSMRTFYELKFTNFSSNYKHYLYKDPLNAVQYDSLITGTGTDATVSYFIKGDTEGYVHPDSMIAPSNWSFADAGTQMQHFKRSTSYNVAKFDITSQVTKNHQIKGGLEGRLYDLTLDEFNIIPAKKGNDEIRPFLPSIPLVSTTDRNDYHYKPIELAAYIQDKMEFDDMIVNLGLRFDYFDSKGRMLADPSDPNIYDPFKKEHKYKNYSSAIPDSMQTEYTVGERESFWYKKADAKMQVSPRFGIAYPITDRGIIHFSYGHFFQMPSFRILYGANDGTDNSNPDLEVSRTSGNTTFLSNANLKPQRTVMYEIGLQQQLAADLAFDVTMFYRDVRDWVGASPLITTALPSVSYTVFENKDYSNVKGVTLSLNKRYSNYFEASLDYSFMVAEGSASNPQDAYFDRSSNRSPRIQLIPLGWDQRHTINGTLGVGTGTWRGSLIVKYWTGSPYTPSFAIGEVAGGSAFSGLAENSARKPGVSSVDLRLFKKFRVTKYDLSIFAYIYNLFDQRSPHDVYSDTGSPQYTLSTRSASLDANRVSTLEDNVVHPEWFGEPRQVQVGFSFTF